jgi:hypothetical protein
MRTAVNLRHRLFLFVAVLLTGLPGVPFCTDCTLSDRSLAAEIPSLDAVAGQWMPLSIVANPPDVNNFSQMLIVGRDLTSYFCHPGGLFTKTKDPTRQWRAGYPLVKLLLDGVEYPAAEVRWYAYRALRRNLDCGGIAVETDTRMVNEERGVLCRVTLTNTTKAPRTIQLALHVPGKLGGAAGVLNTTQNPRTTSALQRGTVNVRINGELKSVEVEKW